MKPIYGHHLIYVTSRDPLTYHVTSHVTGQSCQHLSRSPPRAHDVMSRDFRQAIWRPSESPLIGRPSTDLHMWHPRDYALYRTDARDLLRRLWRSSRDFSAVTWLFLYVFKAFYLARCLIRHTTCLGCVHHVMYCFTSIRIDLWRVTWLLRHMSRD